MTGIMETSRWGCNRAGGDNTCTNADRMKIYVQPKKREIYRPATKYCPQNAKIDKNSVYRQSYKALGTPRPAKLFVVPKSSLCLRGPDEQFGQLTIHRASFPEWPLSQRLRAEVPYDHDLVGDAACEPMQAVTSQRHDYVCKRLSTADRSRSVFPVINLACCDRCPMDSVTTTATAFDGGSTTVGAKRQSARPMTAGEWKPSRAPMASETEASASYRPWDPRSRYNHYAALAYRRPNVAVNDCTVYSGSYRPPGVFRDPLPGEQPPANRFSYCADATNDAGVANGDNDGDAAATHTPFYPRAHDYNL